MRRLRILCFLQNAGFLRHYGPVVRELAERGHELHIALSEPEKDAGDAELADRVATLPGVTVGEAPSRPGGDRWHAVAGLERALADVARFAHPRYARSPALRRRAAETLAGRVEARTGAGTGRVALRVALGLQAWPNALVSDGLVRLLGRVERAIPTAAAIDAYVRERAPDVILAGSVVDLGSSQVEFVKSGLALGLPTAALVASWDNLTVKGLVRVVPDRVLVWNEVQRRELAELHRVPLERSVATGSPRFETWFDRVPSSSAEDLAAKAGLQPGPYVLYVCSSPFVAPDEVTFVRAWLAAVRERPELSGLGVLIRPHPQNAGQWRDVDLADGNATIWPRGGAQPDEGEAARDDFFDAIAHSAAVVGINTSALIEGGIAGKSVLSVLAPEFASTQEGTLHFQYLRAENGGFVHVARDLAEHVLQLESVFEAGEEDAARIERFIESFVRPGGAGRRASELAAHAIEALAGGDRSGGMTAKVVGRPLLSGLRSLVVPRDEWEAVGACPICGSGEHVVEAIRVTGSDPGATVSVCLECEHGYLSRRPTPAWYAEFYAGGWDARGQRHVEKGTRARIQKPSTAILDFCADRLPREGRVLEIGAGFGAELLGFRERGYEVVGVEPSAHRAAFVEQTLGIPCFATAFEEAPLEGPFRLVFTSHVLEHVADVRAFVAKAASLLEPGGLVYVAVPTLWREPPAQAAHFVPHTSLFTPRSLTLLLESNGFRVLKSVVGGDIRILAALEPGAETEAGSSAGSRRAFADSLATRLWEAFGGRSSEHTVVWHRARDKSRSAYDERAYRTSVGKLVRLIQGHRKSLPTHRLRVAWKHSGPELVVSSSLRALDVSLSGQPALPLTIDYGSEPAPVWVK